jgi:hypothetical protein
MHLLQLVMDSNSYFNDYSQEQFASNLTISESHCIAFHLESIYPRPIIFSSFAIIEFVILR